MNHWVPPFYFCILVAFLGVYILNNSLIKVYNLITSHQPTTSDEKIKILLISEQQRNFDIEKKVFNYLNYEHVESFQAPWDILWITEYPFYQHEKRLKNLKPNQRINHFPGFTQLTMKRNLATKFHQFNFIPRGFTYAMKNELFDFAAKNPDKKFVSKASSNRGVRLIENINEAMSEGFDFKEKFVQVFVHNPLLIDNRMFDIGVYVLISSFAPLKIYRFDKEILVRACAKDYHPFVGDSSQYIIDDNCIPVWDLPTLRDDILELNVTCKASLEGYLRRHGHNTTQLLEQIDEIIVTVLIENEHEVVRESQNFGDPSRNFFEILRFDFIIDETLQAHLMEVQMSPQLGIRKDTKFGHRQNSRTQLLYDALSLLNLHDVKNRNNENFPISDPRDITISSSEANCHIECDDNNTKECNLCAFCLGKEEMKILQQTFQEHMSRRRMKRIFPKAIYFNRSELIGKMHSSSKFILKWIHNMCKVDGEWC